MKKTFKRVVGALLIAALSISAGKTAIASNKNLSDITKSPIFYESLSQYTGLSVEELKDIEKNNVDLAEMFGVYVEGANGGYSTYSSTDPSDDVVPMTQTQYNNLLNTLVDGDIMVTKDSWTVIVNHGHSCMVDDVYKYTSGPSVYVIEAFGPDTLSDRYKLGDLHNHWRNYNRVRVYYPTNTTTTVRNNAATYAWENLQDKKYDALADVNSSTYLNCATLVWKAYKSQNVDLQKSFMAVSNVYWYTVYPNDFVTDPNNTCRLKVNWSGGDHTW